MQIPAKCRKCETCIKERKLRWIGRMLAAEQTARQTWFCTFTYGGGYDNDRAYWLDYADLQRTFKRYRKAGHRFQYLAVGEYGSKANRAHFHGIIYWDSEPPDRPMGVQLNKPDEQDPKMKCHFWDKGIVQYEFPKSQQAAAVYMMEYLDKENLQRNALRFSKNPSLGQKYLLKYAEDRATHGLALFPDGPSFTIPGNTAASGKPFWYALGRDSAVYDKMLMHWLETWAVLRPEQPLAMSDEVSDWLSDSTQNPETLSAPIRALLYTHYDIACHVAPAQEWNDEGRFWIYPDTHVSVNEFMSYNPPGRILTVFNKERKPIWRGVPDLAEIDDHGPQSEVPLNLEYEAVRSLPEYVLTYLLRSVDQPYLSKLLSNEVQVRSLERHEKQAKPWGQQKASDAG